MDITFLLSPGTENLVTLIGKAEESKAVKAGRKGLAHTVRLWLGYDVHTLVQLR